MVDDSYAYLVLGIAVVLDTLLAQVLRVVVEFTSVVCVRGCCCFVGHYFRCVRIIIVRDYHIVELIISSVSVNGVCVVECCVIIVIISVS